MFSEFGYIKIIVMRVLILKYTELKGVKHAALQLAPSYKVEDI